MHQLHTRDQLARGRRSGLGVLFIACLTASLVALSGVASAQTITGYQEPTATGSIKPGTGTVSVSCPTGDVVVGGGYQVPNPSFEVVLASEPTSDTAWGVLIANNDPSGALASVTAYAVCVSNSVSGYQRVTQSASIAGGVQFSGPTATCPSNNVVVGGGFNNPTGVEEVISQPEIRSSIVNNAWTSNANNTNKTLQNVSVTAICVSSSVPGYEEPTNNTTISTTPQTVSSPCATGNVVLGGGFAGRALTIATSDPTSDGTTLSSSTWSSIANASPGDVITVTAICATPLPTVTSLKPSFGAAAGGNLVEVLGTNLTGATVVNFGGTPQARPRS
jgi:hypothetical protein